MAKISGFVVSQDNQNVIEACLRSLRFADELIVLDRSSRDRTVEIARGIADQVVTVPRESILEQTRAAALEWCHHDIIVFLNGDECFSSEAVRWLDRELRASTQQILAIARCTNDLDRHHSEHVFSVRAFRRGAIDLRAGMGPTLPDGAVRVGPDGEVCYLTLTGENITALLAGYDALEANAGINTSKPSSLATPATLPRGSTELIVESDKHFWHRYTDTYLRAFAQIGAVSNVLEFGVHHGGSIRWLASCFAGAHLTGVDILPHQPIWPVGPTYSYWQVDQGDRAAVRAMLSEQPQLDLIIEDGSHVPQHQANCLIEAFGKLRPGGLYILEDIATSHPLQPAFAHFSLVDGKRVPNVLNVLLAIQHRRDIGRKLDPPFLQGLAHPDFFSAEEIAELDALADSIHLFKRTQLPLRCYACGGSDFNYVDWRCNCGAELYEPADSMAALIWRNGRAA